MNLSDNLFSSVIHAQGWKQTHRLDVFLSHSADCQKICEAVQNYLNNDLNATLREYNLIITPLMYENWPPTLKNGNASESSLKGVESSSILFAFVDKKHGNIRNEEIFHSIKLYSDKKIQDVCVFFRKQKKNDKIPPDKEINELKEKLKIPGTYFEYASDFEIIKKVSQIVIKAICELKIHDGVTFPEERLISSGEA